MDIKQNKRIVLGIRVYRFMLLLWLIVSMADSTISNYMYKCCIAYCSMSGLHGQW